MIIHFHTVPRCKRRAAGRPGTVPARSTEGGRRGRWWSRHGSLQAEGTSCSRTSRTASAAPRRASPRPHTGRCPPRSGTSLTASDRTHKDKVRMQEHVKAFTQSAREKLNFHHNHRSNPSLMASAGRTIYFSVTPGDCAVHCIGTKPLTWRKKEVWFKLLETHLHLRTHTLCQGVSKQRPAGSRKTRTAGSHMQQLTVTWPGSLLHSAPRDANTKKKHILGFTWNQFARITSRVI